MKKLSFAVLAVLVLAGCTKQSTQADQTDAVRKQASRAPEATQSAKPTNNSSENSAMGQMMSDADYRFKLEGIELPKREGWVTLTAVEGGKKTKVLIELKDATGSGKATATPRASASASSSATAATGMPAHIHLGSCPKPGEVKYPLTDVVNGSSVTTVAATIDQMMALGAISVNVHKSAAELSKYVACGNVDFKSAKPSSSVKASGTAKASASATPRAAASATPNRSVNPSNPATAQ